MKITIECKNEKQNKNAEMKKNRNAKYRKTKYKIRGELRKTKRRKI